MNRAASKFPQGLARSGWARATALLTVASLQLFWLGILLCAVECAKGACHGPVAGAADLVSGHCGHSKTAPGTPAGNPHSRNCPASYLRYLDVSRTAVTPSQVQIAEPVAIASVLPRASTPISPVAAPVAFTTEISPPQIAAAQSPLRI